METTTRGRSIKKAPINRANKSYFGIDLTFFTPRVDALSISSISCKIDSLFGSYFAWVSTTVCTSPLVFDFFIANENKNEVAPESDQRRKLIA